MTRRTATGRRVKVPGANRNGSPEKKEVNSHLWRYHRIKGKGGVFDRLIQHDELHAQGNDEGYAGSPLHRHTGATAESVGEVIEFEGEGT